MDEQEQEQDDSATIMLASGGTVRVTQSSIEVQPENPDHPLDITDLSIVKNVLRIEHDVTITRVRRRTMQITLTSEEDAALLETRVRAVLDSSSNLPGAGVVGQEARWLPGGMLVCAVLVVIGSLGPWAEATILTVNGSDWDGSLTLLFGILAVGLSGLLLWQPWRRGWTLHLLAIAFALAAMVGTVDWVDVGRAVDETGIDLTVGWGLPLMTTAAGLGVTLALARYRHRPMFRPSREQASPSR